MLKQNAVRSKNAKLKCREFPTLQNCEIKMQQKISVLQYSKGKEMHNEMSGQ